MTTTFGDAAVANTAAASAGHDRFAGDIGPFTTERGRDTPSTAAALVEVMSTTATT